MGHCAGSQNLVCAVTIVQQARPLKFVSSDIGRLVSDIGQVGELAKQVDLHDGKT